MQKLLQEIHDCRICEKDLPLGPRPVLAGDVKSKIVIIGQAPGKKVHESGIPWDDASGERLRKWMNISHEDFYNPEIVALVPMGFCYPGKGKSGDLPPRPECAPKWHPLLLTQMNKVQLRILIGQYAMAYYLGDEKCKTLTETVRNYERYLPAYLTLPHPSPRNNIWLRKNPWFEKTLLPKLQKRVHSIVSV